MPSRLHSAYRAFQIAALCAVVASLQPALAESPVEQRVQRLERILDNRVLIDLVQRIDGLQREVRELRGEIEVQRNAIEIMDQRNRDLYIDTDRRLQNIENRANAAAITPDEDVAIEASRSTENEEIGALISEADQLLESSSTSSQPTTGALVSQSAQADPDEQRLFDSAYLDLINGRYGAATAGFEKLLNQYPDSALNAGALYWIGEAQYAQRQFDQARGYFDQLLVLYPTDNKVPDAQVKLGFVQQELGDIDGARKTLEAVVSRHPRTTAALLAQRRLSELGE